MLLGVTLGQMVGAVPGIGPIMAMAIAIPFTFGLDSLPAIAFLVGVNKGGLVGGAVPAVLMNTPGTPDAAATALDGHPLAKQGKPLKATKMALFSSITGDTFSDIVLITVSAPLAILALKMGPIEVAALMIFAFSIFWMYLFFSQYIVIWYANLPEETQFFQLRQLGQTLFVQAGDAGWTKSGIGNLRFHEQFQYHA